MASKTSPKNNHSFTFTVGKLDAGMAILIGSRAHLIEFPSTLLPDGVTTGSIVNIAVHRNVAEEEHQKAAFWKLQNEIYTTFGIEKPSNPVLKLRNVTQTSVTLEWDPLKLATASLRSLDIYRSGLRLASIPNPSANTSTKLSSLQIDHRYTFQLVLRTSAGEFPSNIIETKTHTIQDTSGICVCFGTILDQDGRDGPSADGRRKELEQALLEMGAKWSDKVQIDTTHFVCTTSAAGARIEEPGVQYQEATRLSIPIVQPDWLLACYYSKKMVPTAPYYLGATLPPLTQAQAHARAKSMSQSNLSRNSLSSARPGQRGAPSHDRRDSAASRQQREVDTPDRQMTTTPPARPPQQTPEPRNSSFLNQGQARTPHSDSPTIPITLAKGAASPSATPAQTSSPSVPTIVTPEPEEDDGSESPTTPSSARRRTGTMNKAFKFPPDTPSKAKEKGAGLTISPPPPPPPVPPIIVVHEARESVDNRFAKSVAQEAAANPDIARNPWDAGGSANTPNAGKKDEVKRVMPEPPTPDLSTPIASVGSGGLARRGSEADEGEIVDIDLD